MHKKKLIAFAVLVLLLVPLGFFLFPSAPGPQVVGDISAKDLAELKSFARRQIWSGTFPNFSWKSIKGLPTAVNLRQSMRLTRVEAKTNNATVELTISVTKSVWRHVSYTLKKGPKGWEVTTMNAFN